MKKLLVITPGFPKDDSETYVIPFMQAVFKAFKEFHPDVALTFVATHRPVAQPFSWHGSRVITLNGNNVKYPMKALFLAKSYYKIRKLINAEKFDGILNLWYNDFSVMAERLHPKTVSWMLGQDVRKSNRILRLFPPDPKKVATVSEYSNQILFESTGIKAHKAIPMAVNEGLFPDLNTGERPIDVFGAGWLSELKNYRLFIEVIAELKKTKPDIKAEIAGAGDQETTLKNLAQKLSVGENIIFSGLLTHAETLGKMNQSKIFLHPSLFEGGPTVYFEALYSGCQLIGILPTLDKPVQNFYCLSDKHDIVGKINELLVNLPVPKRVSYYSMDFVCKEIYGLYFP
jgi:glycosyltransferase involved in cell wall biosynthesis